MHIICLEETPSLKRIPTSNCFCVYNRVHVQGHVVTINRVTPALVMPRVGGVMLPVLA